MLIMDYEKLHKDTINKLQQMVSCGKITVEVARGICADFIPESEDEKIRKEMIFYFTEEIPQCSIQEHSDKMRVFISWLKRQEVERTKLELKSGNSYFCYKSRWERADSETFKKGLIYKCNKDGVLDNFVIKNPEQHFIEIKDERIAWLEKQGEQRSVNKVEQKFNVGDWVVWDNKISCHIDNIYQGKESLMYTITDVHNITRSCSVKGFDNNAHLWTIQDAKDGEVLAAHECYVIFKEIDGLNIKCYCTYHYIGFNPSFYVDTLQNKTAFYPATKKQREFLFKKMHDAGYEWDSEKKELKKIEQKQEWRKAKKVVQWLKIYFKK